MSENQGRWTGSSPGTGLKEQRMTKRLFLRVLRVLRGKICIESRHPTKPQPKPDTKYLTEITQRHKLTLYETNPARNVSAPKPSSWRQKVITEQLIANYQSYMLNLTRRGQQISGFSAAWSTFTVQICHSLY